MVSSFANTENDAAVNNAAEQCFDMRYNSRFGFWEAYLSGEPSHDELKQSLLTLVRTYRTQPTSGLLYSEQELLIDASEIMSWLFENVLPSTYAKGLRQVAIVESKSFRTQASSHLIMHSIPQDYDLSFRHCKSYDEAVAYLTHPSTS